MKERSDIHASLAASEVYISTTAVQCTRVVAVWH